MSFIFLYNTSYGGFDFTDEFIKIFNHRYNENYLNIFDFQRDDPRIIELIKEVRSNIIIEPSYSKISAKSFPIKYKGFIQINEYDGKECIYIDYNSYFIKKFLKIDPTDSQKISELQNEINIYNKDKSYNGENVDLNSI